MELRIKKQILVFEKDEDILEFITQLLEEEGYEVKSFLEEEGVLTSLKEDLPDLIILDVYSLSIKGLKLCKDVISDKRLKNVPLIVISTQPNAKRLKNLGVDAVIEKPFDLAQFEKTVRQYL